MIWQTPGMPSPAQVIPRLVSWALFMLVAAWLLKKHKMTTNIATGLVTASVVVNGIILGPLPNPVAPIQGLVIGQLVPAFVVSVVALLVISLLFGRLFCGYACPVGALQELIWRAREKVLKKRGIVKIPANVAAVVRGIAFVLMLVLGLVVTPAVGLFNLINPFHLFSPQVVWNATMGITIALLALSIFAYRPFCRLICPFGFLANLVGRLRGKQMHPNDACIKCGACDRACPSGDMREHQSGGDCYMCGRCQVVCPKTAMDYL